MNHPVIIVGGGPVGLMLACELGLAGVETLVLERLAEPDERSYGMAINSAVVELLSQRGLMDPLREDGFEFAMAHFAHLPLDPTRTGGRHPYAFAVPHAKLSRRLEERAVKLGALIRRDAEIVRLVQDEEGVVVELRSGEQVRGRYLVGCDGARSTVRKLAGIGFPGVEMAFEGLTGDLTVEPGDPLMTRLGFHQHDQGFFTLAPAAADVLRITVGEFGVQPADPAEPVTLTELHDCVERVTGIGIGDATARWLARWNTPTRHAERYRSGRVFLAGDAAHVHFPLGGQALSTGMEDAVNLGWKLASAVHGRAPATLLDTYHDERHPVGARACATTRAQVALMYPMESVGPLRDIVTELIAFGEVNDHLVRMVGGLDVRYSMDAPAGDGADGPHPLLGHRLSDVPLRAGAEETSVATLLRTGRGLFLDMAGHGTRAAELAPWADRLDVVAVDPAPELDAGALLVRPDGRVAWAAPAKTAEPVPPAVLISWFGEPR